MPPTPELLALHDVGARYCGPSAAVSRNAIDLPTSAEAEAFVKARFAAMTSSQRALMALQMFETAQQIVLSSLPHGLDEDQRRREPCRRFYGEALARAAFAPAPAQRRGDRVSTRRALVQAAAAGLLVAPLAGHAQPARKLHRIGILGSSGASATMAGPQPRNASMAALLRGLRELGWVYGENFVTEPRGSEGVPERLPGLAAELVRLQVDVIVAAGPALPALKQATSTIPVVMAASSDPVGYGYVQTLGRPGSNITGLSLQSTETTGKRIELLKELVPGSSPVAVLWNRQSLLHWQAAQAAARERGWKLLPLEIRDAREIEATFKAATDARAGAALATAAGILFPHRRRVAEIAARSRLPVMYELRPFVEAGGLISYGADINDIWRRAAGFVDKILKGAKPADMPVEQPTKFELVINRNTARALGLTIPPALLLRADAVIE